MGINEIQDVLTLLAEGQDVPHQQIQHAFQIIMNGGATPGQMGAFLMGLRQKGETIEEITAGAEVLRAKSATFHAPENAIDTCGTGGDMKRTYNISTAAAIVTAACGVPVAKHGNRSISSASGSSDILQSLNVNIMAEPEIMERAISECNLCFMMAPKYHAAMRYVAPVRTELGLRTIFNLLGPLANPAKVKRQILGVYDKKWVEPLAYVLKNLGSIHAWVVCGADGMDEITLTDETYVAELKGGEVRTFTITPEQYGFERCEEDELKGYDAEHNAKALKAILIGEKNAYLNIVLLNSAAALLVAGKVATIEEGITLANETIDSRQAIQTLEALIEITSEA